MKRRLRQTRLYEEDLNFVRGLKKEIIKKSQFKIGRIKVRNDKIPDAECFRIVVDNFKYNTINIKHRKKEEELKFPL